MASKPASFVERLLILLSAVAILQLLFLAAYSLRQGRRLADVEREAHDLEKASLQLAQLEGQVGTIRKERADLEAKLQGLKKEREALDPQLAAARKEKEAAETKATAVQKERDELNAKLQAGGGAGGEEKKALEARAAKAEADLAAAKKDRETAEAKLRAENAALREERTTYLADLHDIRSNLESWWAEAARARDASAEGVREASTSSLEAMGEIRSGLDQTQAAVRSVAPQVTALAAEVAALRKIVDGSPRAAGKEPGAAKGPGDGGALASPNVPKAPADVIPALLPPPGKETREGAAVAAVPAVATASKDVPREVKDIATPSVPPPAPAAAPASPAAPPAAASTRIEARVRMAVQNMIVLEKGAQAGLREGLPCEIRRGGQKIGRAQLTLVKPEMAGGKVQDGVEVQPGDVAVFEGI